jgi:hypothetical protein
MTIHARKVVVLVRQAGLGYMEAGDPRFGQEMFDGRLISDGNPPSPQVTR